MIVKRHVFTGDGEDGLGNDNEQWSDPVDVEIIQFVSSAQENINGYTSRIVAAADLYFSPDLGLSVRDRVTLPGDPDLYEVCAIEYWAHGFHGWTPGSNIAKLKKVTG